MSSTPAEDLDEVLALLLQEVEAGHPLAVAGWVGRYPHWEDKIRSFAADLAHFGRLLGMEANHRDQLTTPYPAPMPRDQASETPSRLGDYELLEELGRGGMGVVYKARRIGTDLEVALKVFSSEGFASAEGLDRLRAEVNSVCRLKHPHIVPIYHYDEDAGRPFFTMELIEGRSLADDLPRFQNNTIQTVHLLIKVARAVHHAHQRQIVHRDLKPGNILVDGRGEPHVADFGLAVRLRLDGALAEEVTPGGSLPWMAPEALRSEREVTTAVDVWALGVILYELLAGRRPFLGAAGSLRQQIKESDPSPPRRASTRPNLDLEAICLKCLRKDPARRYGSAEALANDLERWLNGRIPEARGRVSTKERFARWYFRYPASITSAVVGVLFLILVTISALSALRAQERRLVEEVLQANEFEAVHVASTVLWQLQRLADAVVETADSPELHRLHRERKIDDLRKFLERSRQRHNDDLRRRLVPAGYSGPLASMILLDPSGRWVAESPINEKPRRLVFPGREYFRVALSRGKKTGRARVHVSRIFQSTSDYLHKLALSIPVKGHDDPDAPITGVLIVTIASDSTFGLDHLHDSRRKAVLIAPRDTNPADRVVPEADFSQLEKVILLHPAYRYGEEPIVHNRPFSSLRSQSADSEFDLPPGETPCHTDEDYRDPVASRHPEYDGRWVAGFAPVGNTELVVGVQRRYDEAVTSQRAFLTRLLGWGGGGLLVVLGLLAALMALIRRWNR
jgi:serine/threonine-protein kinase